MNHRFNAVTFKHLPHTSVVANVAFFKRKTLAKNLFESIQNRRVAVAEIVENDDFMTAFDHFYCSVRTDKTGPTGKQNTHY